jgi:copper homeostasis protein (lipoprotein)
MQRLNQFLTCTLLAASLAACQTPANRTDQVPKHSRAVPAPAFSWAGSWSDTIPCADCPGILTRLDLRADSTYVLRSLYLERDSIPQGQIGKWTVMDDILVLATADVPMRWGVKGDALEMLGPDGRPAESALPYAIQRTAIPDTAPMHLAGAYVYYADSHGFTPEGAGFVLPVAMDPPGVKGAALELERAYARRVKTPPDPLYVRITASLREGPAMEGNGTEEYLHVLRVEQAEVAPAP